MVIDAAPVRVAHRLSVAASIMSPMELWSMAFLMCISQPVAPVRPTASIARLPIRGTTTDQRHGIAAWPLPDHQLPAHRPGISLRDTRRCTLRHRHQLGEKKTSSYLRPQQGHCPCAPALLAATSSYHEHHFRKPLSKNSMQLSVPLPTCSEVLRKSMRARIAILGS